MMVRTAPVRPRIAITGIGVVSPFGVGRERYWDHVTRGVQRHARHRRVRRLGRSAARWRRRCRRSRIEDAPSIDGVEHRGRHAITPIRGAIRGRRWPASSPRARPGSTPACASASRGAGVIVGSGAGGIEVGERQYREFFTDGLKKVTPYAIPVSIVGMVSSEISIALRLHGISHVLSTGCTSSTDADRLRAVAAARRRVRRRCSRAASTPA